MKRIILLFAVLTAPYLTGFAGNDKPITVTQLPTGAKQLVETYFKDINVAYAKMEDELFDKSYEVVFVDGSKVEFDKKGNWTDIDCKFTQVPSGIIPQKILTYITTHQQGRKVIEIDRDKNDYEVKLDQGLELKFDLQCNLISYDD